MRITNSMIHNDMILTLNRHKSAMAKVENELATGVKISKPSDDPTGSVNQMIYLSRMAEFNQYERNVQEAHDRINMIDNQLGNATDIMHRIRELTVQAANGINSKFELRESIGKEIEQHLLSMVDLANVKDSTGRPLFGGSVIERDPFTAIFERNVTEGVDNGRMLSGVVYQGDNLANSREIERREAMDVSIPGNKAFWGTNMTITTNKDSGDFIAQGNQTFAIDGYRIDISAGDTIENIIDKINNAPIEVKASLGGNNDLILSTETPHQIWLEDMESSTILQDLGVIDGNNKKPGNNISAAATVNGMSIFDVVIQLRKDLYNGDQLAIGGRDLEAIDMAMENLLRYRAEAGARVNRLESHTERLAMDKTYTQELLAKNESVDEVESIVNLKWLENVNSYALKVGAGMIKPTLMDFLR